MKNKTIDQIFDDLARSKPDIMTRKKFAALTGGLLSEKTLANLDCSGDGILPRFRIGGKVAYPTEAAVEWLKARVKPF